MTLGEIISNYRGKSNFIRHKKTASRYIRHYVLYNGQYGRCQYFRNFADLRKQTAFKRREQNK